MAKSIRFFSFFALVLVPLCWGLSQPQENQPQQPVDTDWYIKLQRPGRPVYLALPDFEVRGQPATEYAKTMTEVAWDDLEFASV